MISDLNLIGFLFRWNLIECHVVVFSILGIFFYGVCKFLLVLFWVFFFFFGFRWNFIEFHVVVLSDLGHFIVMGIKVLLLLFYYLFLQMEFD